MRLRTICSGRHSTGIRLATVLALFGVLGCEGIFGSDDGISAVLSVDRAVMSATDTARIVVTVTNRSTRPVDVAGGVCLGTFQILDSMGEMVAPAMKYCILSVVVPITLERGESHLFEYRWSADDTVGGDVLSAGTYDVRARIFVYGDVITSAPVAITVDD